MRYLASLNANLIVWVLMFLIGGVVGMSCMSS